MKKHLNLLICLFIGNQLFAQQHIINTNTFQEKLNEEEIFIEIKKTMPKDGWVQIIHENKNGIFNASNPDYFLFIQLNCINNNPPGYFIEYTDNYRDGEFGGIDFISADDSEKANFLVDGIDFNNPFRASGKNTFNEFVLALKKGKKLTLKVRERSIDFKLAHSELLNTLVECSKAGNRTQENETEAMNETIDINTITETTVDATKENAK